MRYCGLVIEKLVERRLFPAICWNILLLAILFFTGLMTAAPPAAETHQVLATTYYSTFSHIHAVLERIRPGDAVVTKTLDASGRDETGVIRGGPKNPLTGPFYIEGAEPGDAITVFLTKVQLNRKWGYSGYRLGLQALSPESVENLYAVNALEGAVAQERAKLVPLHRLPWDIDIARQIVRLSEPASNTIKLEFPVKPMLGCIGVAPARDFAPTSVPAGSYGGNLDYNEIRQGTTVILPVYQPGALLFIGDGHALQADGEPIGNGIETSMRVEFVVGLRKNVNIPGPRAETGEFLISIGSQPEFSSSLDRGLQMATSDMVNWLVTDYGLEPWAAHLLIGYEGKYDVVTVAGSMALRIPKKYLPPRR
jgi:amidase